MKKHLSRLIAFLLALAVFTSAPIYAFADSGISNSIKGSGTTPKTSAATGKSLFFTASNAKTIDQPNAADYCSSPFYMYVNAPKEHSVYVYDTWAATEINNIGTTYHGGRVTVLAEHGNFSCILFRTWKYELKVAWVSTEYLTSWYPGYAGSIGRSSYRSTYNAGDPVMKWSKENFVGTQRKYSILESPIKNCVGFTLDYQLVSNNGASKDEVLGPRNVYVNDGSGWTYVGTFEYKKAYACHVDVSLEKPMTLVAVATIADCAKPDTFVFRQAVLDVMCTN